MRLVLRIMAGVMVVMALLLAVHSYLVVNREIAQFRDDMDLHAYLLGTVLSTSVSDVWNSVGSERARSIVADANRSEALVRVRIVRFDVPPGDPATPLADRDSLSVLRQGKEVLLPEYSYHGSKYHIAYFPVTLDSGRPCALELSQPLASMQRYTRITIIHKIALFIAFLVVGGGLLWWFGVVFVGRPIRALVSQAQAVGSGDLDANNQLEQSGDEIGALARGLNRMVSDLRAARTRLEKETEQRIAAVEQLNHAERLSTIGKLASGLAHELGTPLNVVAGRAKMIADAEMKPSEVLDSAAVIRQQAERMTRLIRQLLDFARREPRTVRQEELKQPVDQAVHTLAPLASQHRIDIKTEVDGEPPRVRIDTAQIQQVLSNLIVNAIHAMPGGGQILVRYGRRPAEPPADHGHPPGTYAFVEVIDSGVGIPEEDFSRIFAPFYSTKGVGEGTGLGLWIAHGIIKEHGGWVTVNSSVGAGSTFSIYLPLGDS